MQQFPDLDAQGRALDESTRRACSDSVAEWAPVAWRNRAGCERVTWRLFAVFTAFLLVALFGGFCLGSFVFAGTLFGWLQRCDPRHVACTVLTPLSFAGTLWLCLSSLTVVSMVALYGRMLSFAAYFMEELNRQGRDDEVPAPAAAAADEASEHDE